MTATLTATRTATVLVSSAGLALVRKLEAAGLAVTPTEAYGQVVELCIDGPGRQAAFGALVVSRARGRVLRGHLTFGNDGATVKAEGLAAVRDLVSRVRPYMAARVAV